MKITLYMATSIDGFIAMKNGDSDWVSPAGVADFEQKIADHGCLIVGHRTFTQFQGDLYPVKGVTNVVLVSKSPTPSSEKNVVYSLSPADAVRYLAENGHDKALLIGGGTTNGLFAMAGLIDEVYLCVHPLILGNGIKLFGNLEFDVKLHLIGREDLNEGLTLLHYSVQK